MLKIELDWADDAQPILGHDRGITLEAGQEQGPSGHPTVIVYANDGQTLFAWLMEGYAQDEEDAEYLAGLAEAV